MKDLDGLNLEVQKQTLVGYFSNSDLDDPYIMQICLENMGARGDIAIFRVFEPVLEDVRKKAPLAVDQAFFAACRQNQIDTAKAILPYVSKDKDFQHFFEDAAKYGYDAIFFLLLPFCDPKRNSSKALANASVFGHGVIFEALYPLSNKDDALITSETLRKKSKEPGRLLEERLLLIEKRDVLFRETEKASFLKPKEPKKPSKL